MCIRDRIDTPPSLGIVTINALVASNGLIVPVQTEYFALEGLAMLVGTIREVRNLFSPDLGVDEYCSPCITTEPI